MNRKAFLIIIDNSLNATAYAKMHEAIKKDNNVRAWWHHIKNTYILITEQNVTPDSIQKFVLSYFPNNNCLILQLKPPYNNYNGWLPENGWNWIENTLNKQ